MKVVLRGKFIALNAHIQKTEWEKINTLLEHLNRLQTKQQTKPKAKRQQEIRKIRAEINSIETNKTIERINEAKRWFFERLNKINKPLANLIKRRKERTQVQAIRNEKGEITTDTAEIKRTVNNYFVNLYSDKN